MSDHPEYTQILQILILILKEHISSLTRDGFEFEKLFSFLSQTVKKCENFNEISGKFSEKSQRF
jgi:hypothetical protein